MSLPTFEREARFPIGTKYKTRGKFPRDCTVIDIYRTYNSAGELVRLAYVASHQFMGREMIERDIPEATVAMGLMEGTTE